MLEGAITRDERKPDVAAALMGLLFVGMFKMLLDQVTFLPYFMGGIMMLNGSVSGYYRPVGAIIVSFIELHSRPVCYWWKLPKGITR